MLGRGGFSFRNESLDLAFRADGKKFSLFSGQSPVGIGGTFARPGIDVISPELVARGGAAAALGIAATPDRKSVVSGKSVSVRVDLGGRRIIKKKKIRK